MGLHEHPKHSFQFLPVPFVLSDYSYAGLEAPKKEQVLSSQGRKNTNTPSRCGRVSSPSPVAAPAACWRTD